MVVFGSASAGCGLAPDVTTLILARVAQSVGAAMTLPGTLAAIARAFPEPGEQARAIGMWAGVGSVSRPAGPLPAARWCPEPNRAGLVSGVNVEGATTRAEPRPSCPWKQRILAAKA
jgi:MFS family permease